MSNQKVKAHPTQAWSDISGAAAGIAGMTWVNNGLANVAIAFQAGQPVNSDSYAVLHRGEAYYDKNGSAKIWAMKLSDLPSTLVGVAD